MLVRFDSYDPIRNVWQSVISHAAALRYDRDAPIMLTIYYGHRWDDYQTVRSIQVVP